MESLEERLRRIGEGVLEFRENSESEIVLGFGGSPRRHYYFFGIFCDDF